MANFHSIEIFKIQKSSHGIFQLNSPNEVIYETTPFIPTPVSR